ncbi:MAG: hypothetical protein EZS28_000399 [Streblomastix strix]|uniref:Uncharacterized protein n=1 Tax=Streblomastix strix TaxID=222440 RepID=A0A5J4X9Z8_9EUKA|nr:MAG: hypothetical protein EZS28_000399 [Streblomastix strix]
MAEVLTPVDEMTNYRIRVQNEEKQAKLHREKHKDLYEQNEQEATKRFEQAKERTVNNQGLTFNQGASIPLETAGVNYQTSNSVYGNLTRYDPDRKKFNHRNIPFR